MSFRSIKISPPEHSSSERTSRPPSAGPAGLGAWLRIAALATLAFALGFLRFYNIEVIGTLGYHEILLLVLAPFVSLKVFELWNDPRHRILLSLGLAYLGSQVLADLYRHSLPFDYLRGWGRIGLTLLMYCVSSVLFVRSAVALVAFVLGSYLVAPATFLAGGAIFEVGSTYKLMVGPPISLAAFLILTLAPKPLKLPLTGLPIIAGLVPLWQGARSLAGVTLLAVVTYGTGRIRVITSRGMSKKKVVRTVALFAVAGFAILEGYRYTASTGMLGADAYEKYEQQKQMFEGENFTLLSGRVEVLFAGPKILASPLIGYGSWPKDPDYVYNRARQLGLNPDDMVNSTPGEPGLIPSHSHLLGPWLEAGLAGGVFWAFALFMSLALLARQRFIRHPKLAPLINFLVVYFVWDLCFSPYSSDRRLWNGFMIAWIASIYYKVRQERRSSTNGVSFGGR